MISRSGGDSGWVDSTSKSDHFRFRPHSDTQITATISAESPTARHMSISTIDDTFDSVAAWFTPNLPNLTPFGSVQRRELE